MLLTNTSAKDFYVGRKEYFLAAGGTVTIPDAVYLSDDAVAKAVTGLVNSSYATASSTPAGYPRNVTNQAANSVSISDAGGHYTEDDVEGVLQEIAPQLGAGTGAALTVDITQSSHGFAVGDVLKFAAGSYAKAQADSADNAEVVGIVSAVADTNNFTLHMAGKIDTLSSLNDNETYFLSPSSAGALTLTEPTTAGQVSKPLLIAVSATSGIFVNWRGILRT